VKLAIVRRRYAQFGGAERFIDGMAGALIGAGIDLTIVASSWPAAGDVRRKTVIVPPRGFTRRGRQSSFERAVAGIYARREFDIVQSHERLLSADIFRAGDGVHAAWLDRLAAERGGFQALIKRLDPAHRHAVATERAMARDTGMIFVANSAMVAREIANWLAVPASRIRTIENGVDTSRFRPPSAGERAEARRSFGLDGPVIAFVGSGFRRKGAFALVEALALPQCKEVRALIAGRDAQLDALRSRVAALRLGGRVQILGGVADPVAVYHAADVFALPSLYDPMPNAALEALCCGLPLLVTADTGVADLVREQGAGAVVTREPDSIAAGLVSVLGQRAMMARAVAALAPRFDLRATTARWLDLYREVAQRSR
jgi:UDP-glucose:(heptosyl)LPS alpha-1,3-glucosyltransferase